MPVTHNFAEVLIDTLLSWDVSILFGCPGGSAHGIIDFLRSHQHRIRFLQVRQDEAAAFMASAYAKYTGKLGVCVAAPGRGAENAAKFLEPAAADGQAVLAMTFLQPGPPSDFARAEPAKSSPSVALRTVFSARVNDLCDIPGILNVACRSALHSHGLAHVDFPSDIPLHIPRPLSASFNNRPARGKSAAKIIELRSI